MDTNLLTLGRIFIDRDQTITYLRRKNLLKQTFICCGQESSQVKSKSSDGHEFKCNICGKRKSLRTGSFFSNVHLPLQILLLLTYLFTTGTPIKYVLTFLKGSVSEKTVGQWYHFLREVISQHLITNRIVLGGRGVVVQIDESALGRKRKYNRGYVRGSGVKWVFGGIDTVTKKCFLELVPDRSRVTLFPIIHRSIALGSEIHSDEAAVYFSLPNEGFVHKTVKHKENYVNPTDGTHTNNIENFWGHLKNKIKSMYGVRNENIPHHLDEFIYRWNNKNENLFEKLLGDISEQYQL